MRVKVGAQSVCAGEIKHRSILGLVHPCTPTYKVIDQARNLVGPIMVQHVAGILDHHTFGFAYHSPACFDLLQRSVAVLANMPQHIRLRGAHP